ncbi:Group-specific protein OS=Lysinibacillus sphaericus OX=1421 GN=LS41612_21375 PE=4 SV=1 [Lysinibacillus sphaericus]
MKKFIISIMSLFPVPFFFYFYEYHFYLNSEDADFLFPIFIVCIVVIGLLTRKINLPLFFSLNIMMLVISLVLGHFFILDDGSWFKPFGKNGAMIFVSSIYILGQLFIRLLSKQLLLM